MAWMEVVSGEHAKLDIQVLACAGGWWYYMLRWRRQEKQAGVEDPVSVSDVSRHAVEMSTRQWKPLVSPRKVPGLQHGATEGWARTGM